MRLALAFCAILVVATTSARAEVSERDCQQLAEFAFLAAVQRDRGVPRATQMAQNGRREVFRQLIDGAYENPTATPPMVKIMALNWCRTALR